ncbi:MAG: hypothetical protein K9G49_06345 [Taibaiella sp.]|nr:hypothetical protein [Taibaiella sp.]
MRAMLIMRILAIITVNLVFWYLIYSSPGNKVIIGMYVFFGTLQLIFVVPKIIRDLKKKA